MKCDLKNRSQVIAAYLTGELAEAAMHEFEQHYFQCEECFQELKIGQGAVNLIEREGAEVLAIPATWLEKARQALAVIFSRRQWAFALAAILLLAASITLLKYLSQPTAPESYAENFQPSPRLDDLMRQTYQSPTLLAQVSPPNDTNFVEEIFFQWRLADEQNYAGAFELRLLNNRGEELYKFKTDARQFHLDKKLKPGLYYWSLLTENEMAHLGRFYVRKP